MDAFQRIKRRDPERSEAAESAKRTVGSGHPYLQFMQLQRQFGNRATGQFLLSVHGGGGTSFIQRHKGEKDGSDPGNNQGKGSTSKPARTSLPKREPLTMTQGHDLAREGNIVDWILHRTAVRVTQQMQEEVPADLSGIDVNKLKGNAEQVPVESKRGQKKKMKEQAKKSTGKNKGEAKSAKHEHSGNEQEKKAELKPQRFDVQVQEMLAVVRDLIHAFQLAALQASPHPRGANVFTYWGYDFVVSPKRYVAPLSDNIIGDSGQVIPTPDSLFANYDYPFQKMSHPMFRSIIEAMLNGEQPNASLDQLTIFIASVAAEITRYEPQLVSVALAMTGATQEMDEHDSLFTTALTMTTGSTDPTSGKHIDRREAFKKQREDDEFRATEPAAIREGGIIRAALSGPALQLDAQAYVESQLEAGTDPEKIAEDLSDMLIYVINKSATDKKKSEASYESEWKRAPKLEGHLTADMLEKHFPDDQQFPNRSADNSSIVLLTPEERARLALELSTHNFNTVFRSPTIYDVAMKVDKAITYGRAHLKLSNSGTDKMQGNHWEGQDWVGETEQVDDKGFQEKKAAKHKASQSDKRAGRRASGESIEERMNRVLNAIKKREEADNAGLQELLQEALDGLYHKDEDKRDNARGKLSQLEGELAEYESLEDLLEAYMPSNQWGIMPETWQRGQASGMGFNCLIDSLLQHTTTLSAEERLTEARFIRDQLVQEGRTGPRDFLFGDEHIIRILQLIGVNPHDYEVRSEWTARGSRQHRETVNAGAPNVIRLWNTGVHYEPIFVQEDNPFVDDIDTNQQNGGPTRGAQPLWMLPFVNQQAEQPGEGSIEKTKGASNVEESDRNYEKSGYVKTTVGRFTFWVRTTPLKDSHAAAKAVVMLPHDFNISDAEELQQIAAAAQSYGLTSADGIGLMVGKQNYYLKENQERLFVEKPPTRKKKSQGDPTKK